MDEVATGSTDRVGERLRAAREARGLTLPEVAERSRIPLRHLETIERGDFADLPALPYSTGFVKVYGNLVGEDGNALSRDFRVEASGIDREAQREEPYEPADPKRVPSRGIAIAGIAAAIVLVLAYLIWRGLPGQEEIARTAAGTDGIAGPAATIAPPPVATAPAASGPVTLVAESDVWMRVYERGGARLFLGVLKAGDTFVVPASATDPLLSTGRPEGLRVTVGDRVAPQLGPPSTLLKDVSLKAAALLGGTAAATQVSVPAIERVPPPVARRSAIAPGSIASEPAPAPPPAATQRPSGQSPPTQPPA